MTTRSTRLLVLAGAGIAALTLSPAVAAGQDVPASPIALQDSAEQTFVPGDDAEVTSEPGDGAEPGDEEGFELEGADDPAVWESLLTEEGFAGVECTVQKHGEEFFELAEAAPSGKEWLVAILLTGTMFDFYPEPYVGEQLWVEGENGQPMPLSTVILCAADLEAGERDPADLGGGLADGGVGEGAGGGTAPIGPVVETDEPVSSPGAGLLLGFGAAGLAGGALAVAGRRGVLRR